MLAIMYHNKSKAPAWTREFRTQNIMIIKITLLHYQPVAQDTSVVDLFSGKQSVASGFRAALNKNIINDFQVKS